jgi:hypothetical protein
LLTLINASDELLLRERIMRAIETPTDRNHSSLLHFIEGHLPLAEHDMEYIYWKDDFITLASGKENSRFDEWVEALIGFFNNKLLKVTHIPDLVATWLTTFI